MQKFSIKEARFVFQEPPGESASGVDAQAEAVPLPAAAVEGPPAPAAAPKAEVVKDSGGQRAEVIGEVRGGVIVASEFKLDKFNEALVGGKLVEVLKLLVIPNGTKSSPVTVSVDYLKEEGYPKMVSQIADSLLPTFKDKEVPADILEITGGTKEDFWKAALPGRIKVGFDAHMKHRLQNDLKHLVAFVNAPDTTFKEFSYFVEYGVHGTPRLDIGPPEFMTAYKAFAEKREKIVVPPTEKKDGEADLTKRAEDKKKLQSIPILKWIAGLFGLNEKEKDENGKVIPNGRDGWDKILDGDHTLALAALDFFGYGKEVPQAEGSFDGMLGFVPEGAQASIGGLRKSVNQPTNPLSAASYRAKLAEKTGKPQETVPGKPAIIAHQRVQGTVIAEIADRDDKTVPKKGVRLVGPATMKMLGDAKSLKIDLKAGNLVVPENSELIVDGKNVKVLKGETKTFTKTDGKDGVIVLEGTLLADTVIDEGVKIEKVS